MTWSWPPDLHLVFGGDGVRSLNVQSWLRNKYAPTTRIQRIPGDNNPGFGELVESLRDRGGVSLKELLPIQRLTPRDSTRLQDGTSRARTSRDFCSRRFTWACSVWHFPMVSRIYQLVTRFRAVWPKARRGHPNQHLCPIPWPCHHPPNKHTLTLWMTRICRILSHNNGCNRQRTFHLRRP